MFIDAFPAAWIRHAHRLNRSAEHLWKPIEHALASQPPFSEEEFARADHMYAFMLVAGASLEAMFKAAAIQATINAAGTLTAIVPDARLAQWLKTHDLIKIAKRAEIDLSEEEKVQLERFTRFVIWEGSYPTPIDVNQQTVESFIANFRFSKLDYLSFRHFFARAEKSYHGHLNRLYERQGSQKKEGDADAAT
jgi:hypothetical protein